MAKFTSASRQRYNELTAGYFALAMLGFMAIFTIVHWVDRYIQTTSARRDGLAVKIIRRGRSVLLRKIPGFTSIGHSLVFVAYVVICVVLSFHNMDWSKLNWFAKRLGWVAACNIALITVLALKNTPLAFLTSYSYERLNILHQAAGYVTIAWTLIHAVVYITACAYSDNLELLTESVQIFGIVAGFAMLIIMASAIFLRSKHYEVFYVLHVSLFMLIVVMLGLHRPNLTKKTLYITFFIAAVWVLDRIFRTSKMVSNFLGNKATLTALPHGGVRVTFKRTPWRAIPGAHAFIWLPTIRKAETHPFTIVNTNPLEVVVSAHDGFTKDLRQMAEKKGSHDIELRCSVDGPYGTLPSWLNFDKIVLVSGGSGGSFSFGVANDLLKRIESGKFKGKIPIIEFVYVVRHTPHLEWYASHLAAIQSSPHFRLSIYVTNTPSPSISEKPVELSLADQASEERGDSSEKTFRDAEKAISPTTSTPTLSDMVTHHGRPDISELLKQSLADAEAAGERIIVGACGPGPMMREVRSTVASAVGSGSGSVRLHVESFGW